MSRKYTCNTVSLKRQIIESLAKNSLSISAVSKELHYHRHTIEYHLHCIWKNTGLNPKNFYDLIKLLETYGENSPDLTKNMQSDIIK